MEVGLDDQFDGQAELLGVGEVLAHVALRVDDDRAPGRLVTDQVRRLRQTVQVVLDELHGRRPFVVGRFGMLIVALPYGYVRYTPRR